MSIEREEGYGNELVRLIYIVYGDDGQVAVIAEVPQGDASAEFDAELLDGVLVGIEADGHAEEVAICKSAVFDDAKEVRAG